MGIQGRKTQQVRSRDSRFTWRAEQLSLRRESHLCFAKPVKQFLHCYMCHMVQELGSLVRFLLQNIRESHVQRIFDARRSSWTCRTCDDGKLSQGTWKVPLERSCSTDRTFGNRRLKVRCIVRGSQTLMPRGRNHLSDRFLYSRKTWSMNSGRSASSLVKYWTYDEADLQEDFINSCT